MFDAFFQVFFYIFSWTLCPMFLMFCFRRTLAETYSTRGIIWFSYIRLFQKIRFFVSTLFGKYQQFNQFPHIGFIEFHDFFSVYFRIDLFIDFNGKLLPKGLVANHWRCSPGHQKQILLPRLIQSSIFGCILVDFWHPLASLLAAFGSCWAPFRSLWHHVWIMFLQISKLFRHWILNLILNASFIENTSQNGPGFEHRFTHSLTH